MLLSKSAVHTPGQRGLSTLVPPTSLERLCPSPYRVPNLWWEEEEILRKSGVPDAPNRRHVPLIIDIKTHPKDINQLLLAYEGGVILLDVKQRAVLKTYQLRHLPGAVGSGVGDPNLIWTERASPATCVTWRPDGLVFACGHEDGCLSFWDVQDDSKPVMVRTLELLDVDKPVGVPEEIPGGPARAREPIFKLAWSGFPEQSWLEMAANATSKVQQQQYQQSHAAQQELTSGSILTILGGATERHPPGLVCLHLPPFALPYSSYWGSKTPEAAAKARQALRSSLDTNLETRYSTQSSVEDFLLVPKSNPYYSLAYDPMAVLILEATDPLLPPLPPPAAARGLSAYVFPPVCSSPHASLTSGIQANFAQQQLNLPLPLSTAGSGAILGAKLIEVSVHAYRTLAGKRDVGGTQSSLAGGSEAAIEAGSSHDIKEDLSLRGGTALPSVVGGALGVERDVTLRTMAKGEKLRILITWHVDGTVRFHDASPQLLLLGTQAETSGPSGKAWHLDKAFPSPLPHLTINVRSLIQNRAMVGHPIFERLNADLTRMLISKVDFAPEALEAAIVLRSGQVLHYKFGYARYSQTEDVREAVSGEVQQDEEAAADLTSHQMSPSSAMDATKQSQHRQSMNKLDGAMAGAMRDLDLSAPGTPPPSHHTRPPSSSSFGSPMGPPPPRPQRDPKRLSVARKIGFSRSNKDSDDAPRPGLISPGLSPPPLSSPDAKLSSPGAQLSPALHPPHFLPPASGVEEITTIGHMASWQSDGFKPNVLVELQRGEVNAVSISDIGFLAIACGLALAVVDMRGPELIIREGFGDGPNDLTRSNSRDRREERRIVEEESKSPICQLNFTICRSTHQPILSPTLITVRENGYVSVWTFTKSSLELWLCERSHGCMVDELRKAISVDVLDMSGNVCSAIPSELQRSLREQSRGLGDWHQHGEAPLDVNLLFGVGPRSISLRVGLTGPRLAKVDVEEDLQGACILDCRGEKVCLALSATSLRLFSLPHLSLITRLQRHNRNREERLSIQQFQVSFDSGGDFVEVFNSLDVRVWTIFATMPRPGPPSLLLYQPPSMPMAPNMLNNVASSVVNWIGGKSSTLATGTQFDEAIAGSKRQPLPKLPVQKYIEMQMEEQQAAAAAAAAAASSTSSFDGQRPPSDALFARKKEERKQAVRDTQEASSQAGWNIDLAKQRGEMMSSLEEGLTSLERGAKGWMQTAREDLIKQAAKDKITKFF